MTTKKMHHDQVLPPDPPPGTSERIEWTPADEAAADRAWATVRDRILAKMGKPTPPQSKSKRRRSHGA